MLRTVTIAAAALLACSAGPVDNPVPPPPPPSSGVPVRLLFIGNSLTYSYNIPGMVKQMAEAAIGTAPVVVTAAYANYALEDHWVTGTARSDVQTQPPFDRVIMQQGPSTLPESGVDLKQWSKTWSNEIRRNGARPGLYVVWPPSGGNLDAGIANYEAAADAANAAIYPVGEAWREAWRVDPAMPLYGGDGFHPGMHGAWLAALVICAVVYDQPVSLFPNVFPLQISEAQATVLRNAATRAIADYARR